MNLVVRTSSDPQAMIGAIQNAIWNIDKDQPVYEVRTFNQMIDRSLSTRRFVMFLLALFGAIAVALAGIGIYALINYSVTRRTHEIGIRLALGAQKRDVLRMVVGNGLVLALSGIGIGVVAVLLLARLLVTLLYGVGPSESAGNSWSRRGALGCRLSRLLSSSSSCREGRPNVGAEVRVACSTAFSGITCFLTSFGLQFLKIVSLTPTRPAGFAGICTGRPKMKQIVHSLATSVFAVLLTGSAIAQSNRGGISGTVLDKEGAVIPGAKVTITNLGTNQKQTLTSSAAGAYSASSLDPVVYRISVEATGFKRGVVDNIKVDTAAVATVDVVLETGDLTNEVTVTAESPIVNSQSGTTGQTISERQIQEIP